MRELKLKYVINLVSDIVTKAKTDEQALVRAQDAVQKAIGKTNGQLGMLERTLLAVGRVGSASAQRQAEYLVGLALRWHQVRQAADGALVAMNKAARGAAAGAAAGYAVDRMAKTPMDYSMRLAHMANTAYAERDAAGRIEGKKTLDAAIRAAIRVGGGSRDDAADALDAMLASGTVGDDVAIKLLPALMKGASGSGATAKGLASIALSSLQAGVKVDDIPNMLNEAMAAGQAGGFELKDMEKWLPSAIAAGKSVGLVGLDGVRRILASMQASVKTAGTKDEAGNNVVNLLGKLNAEDTAADFKKQKIDLRKELMNATANGGNALDAFIGLVDRVTAGVQRDPKFKQLSARLAKEGDQGAETATTEALRALFQGTAVSKIVQDRQALMALVAELNNRGYVADVQQKMRTNTKALDTSFSVISAEAGFARQAALNEWTVATQTVFDKAAPALSAVAGGAADLAREFPGLATGVVAATGAVGVFAAALTASSVLGVLGRGGAGSAGLGVLGSMLGTPARMSNGGMWARQLGGVFGPLAGAGIDAWGVAQDPTLTDAGKRRGYAGAAAGAAGGWGGAYAGAALGTALFPGVGTLIGGALGGLGGYMAGHAALDWLWKSDPSRDLITGQPVASGAAGGMPPAEIKLGEGRLDVNVRVTDDRVTAATSVAQSPALVRVNAGNTNPAGYSR